MDIKELKSNSKIGQLKRLKRRFDLFEKLINELRTKQLNSEIIQFLNMGIDEINRFSGTAKQLARYIQKFQFELLRKLEKDLKLVPKNLYRNRWMAIGMAAFGVSIGVAFGVALNNMAFLAIGIPIGMSIGLAIGAGMDKKAADEGRQLDMEISF